MDFNMFALGMDIGTTNLSSVLMDISSGKVLDEYTIKNDAAIVEGGLERLQDVERIFELVEHMRTRLSNSEINCIGLTGQMHGMLYTDCQGKAVSPLYTWQDRRGDYMRDDGQTYTQYLSSKVKKKLATGYGAVTHYYNIENGLVPQEAKWVTTIQDYIGMKLTKQKLPQMHISNSESFGAPEWEVLSPMIRTTEKSVCIGTTSDDIPVAIAIGDNQASFIGSVNNSANSLLINMGTGGQISILANGTTIECPDIDKRYYIDGDSLLVGCSLCGGHAYSLLETFYREIIALAGVKCDSLYEKMNALAEQVLSDELIINTQFRGSRRDPEMRGTISNISDRNLTPAHLVQAVLKSMVNELLELYYTMCESIEKKPTILVGAGNGIRKNPALQKMFEDALGMQMNIPLHYEEAAYGAALFSTYACGINSSLTEAQKVIRYH